MFKKFLKEIFKCRHKTAILTSDEGYCPECGKYLKKVYYIVRCDCCGIKRTAKRKFNEISPVGKYCTNCGESSYKIEKCDKLNIVDVNYAIEVKEEVENNSAVNELEIWIEDGNCGQNNNYILPAQPLLLPKMN